MIFNETNYTALFAQPYLNFNGTNEVSMSLVNGTGALKMGYVSAYCRVEGMDLLLELQIAQTVFLLILVLLVSFYVTLYYFRGFED